MKVGIFGGSFDPVHNGHVKLAVQAKDEAKLDKLIFVPAKLQPFKLDKKATDGAVRVEMLKLALRDYPELDVSSYELNRDEISYTVNTLHHFREIYGDDTEIFFLTGTDSFIKIHTWMRADEILSGFSLIVGSRPGYMEKELYEQKKSLEEKFGINIVIVNNEQVDVSSTEIREKAARGESLEGLADREVERYIRENRVYG